MFAQKNNSRTFLSTTSKATAGVFITQYLNIIKSKPKLHNEVIGHEDFTFMVHMGRRDFELHQTPFNNWRDMVMDS